MDVAQSTVDGAQTVGLVAQSKEDDAQSRVDDAQSNVDANDRTWGHLLAATPPPFRTKFYPAKTFRFRKTLVVLTPISAGM